MQKIGIKQQKNQPFDQFVRAAVGDPTDNGPAIM
jgi:hypothetical protein